MTPPAGAAGAPEKSTETETSASSEETVHLEPAAGTSARVTKSFIPPDGKRPPWRVRHREKLYMAEWALIALFFAIATYFLWLLIFPSETGPLALPAAPVPGREGFLAALSALPPAAAGESWRVAAAPGRWNMIVVHHTATEKGDPGSIDRYHRENNKWENGLGYHFLIGNGRGMADGEVFTGVRWTRQLDGAHVRMAGGGNANSFAIGIALVGNFQKYLPTAPQLASLRGLLGFLMEEYGIPPSRVAGHGAVSERATKCPGEFFFMEEVLRAVAGG